MAPRHGFFTMWVCGKLRVVTCGNVEILWVSFEEGSEKGKICLKGASNRTIWNGVVTPVLCGKKVLAIGRDTLFIVSGIVQRTYAVCYGFLIAVIHAKCNAAETGLLYLARWSRHLDQSDLTPGTSIRVWSALQEGVLHHRSTNNLFNHSKYVCVN